MAGGLVEQVKQGLHEIVGLHRASRNAHNSISRRSFPSPSEIVRQPHAPRGIAFHRVNSAVGGAGSGSDHSPGFGRQPVDPFAGRDGLPGLRVSAERSPVSLALVLLVGNGAFDHQDERRPSSHRRRGGKCRRTRRRSRKRARGCRTRTFGSHGIPPLTTSSRLGCVAAVIAMVSPSHPRPAVIHRTSIARIGSTAANAGILLLFVLDSPRIQLTGSANDKIVRELESLTK